MPSVRVLPDELSFTIDTSQDLLSALRANEFQVEGICNGKGTCGKCLVRVISGQVSEPTATEREWQLVVGEQLRLACQVRVLSDITIQLPESSRTSEAKILMAGKRVEGKLMPVVRAVSVEIRPPTLSDQTSDVERLLADTGAKSYNPALLRTLPGVLRGSGWSPRAVLRGDAIIDLTSSGEGRRLMGVAADIGTTTVVAYLFDLLTGELLAVKADYNGQIRYGEDVVTRISHILQNRTGLDDLKGAVVATMNHLIDEALKEVGASIHDVYDLVVAGNSVMTSLLVGADPSAIAKAPYTPPFSGSVAASARELGLLTNDSCILRSLPLISGYVGGDVVGDIIVSGMHKSESLSLLIDLGTNGEVVIGSSKGMLTASCAAGPALEGYGITRGMRAMSGAIESVAIDRRTGELYLRTISSGKPKGICGSGVVDSIAAMLAAGVLEPSGRMALGSSERMVRHNGELAFVVSWGRESADGKDILLTQGDVRRLQLAKAAIYAATSTLMSEMGVQVDQVERLYVAGAFGNYVSPVNAMMVGLLPEMPLDRVVQIGNGSGMGACTLVLDQAMWREVEAIPKKTRAVELNLIPGFQKRYLDATFLPHKDESLFHRSRAALQAMRQGTA